MNAPTKQEHIFRQRFAARVLDWWPEADEETISQAVNELMTDIGYTIKKPSIRKTDPELYKMTQREYMREYQRKQRANAKKAVNTPAVVVNKSSISR